MTAAVRFSFDQLWIWIAIVPPAVRQLGMRRRTPAATSDGACVFVPLIGSGGWST